MTFTGFYICPECKPEAVRKLAMGLPVGSLWRKGKVLVALRDATLPGRCVKCNTIVEGAKSLTWKLYWRNPFWALLLLATPLYCLGIVLYLIAGIFVQKSAKISAILCRRHRRKRAAGILGGALAILIGLVFLFVDLASVKVAGTSASLVGWVALAGFFFMIAGCIWYVLAFRVFVPVKIDATHVHTKGVCRAFLSELPEWPGA
jgi:hypothetical protein